MPDLKHEQTIKPEIKRKRKSQFVNISELIPGMGMVGIITVRVYISVL